MNLGSYIIGSHLMFFREGSAYTLLAPGGICGAAAKPDPTDPAWLQLGACEKCEPDVAQKETKLWAPSPGRLVLSDILETQQELSLKVTTNQVSAFTMESMLRTSQQLGGAQQQFNPLTAISRRGWLHIQCYDETDTLFLTMDMWVRLRAKGKFDEDVVKPEWDIFMLYNTLNTGLTALS